MTSNLASEEIANYAQELRREEEKKPPLVNTPILPSRETREIWKETPSPSLDEGQPQEDDERKSRITVSKQFKNKVVKPILKVLEASVCQSNDIVLFTC